MSKVIELNNIYLYLITYGYLRFIPSILKAWTGDGLSMSTTNNEACKLFDAALTQVQSYQNYRENREKKLVTLLQCQHE